MGRCNSLVLVHRDCKAALKHICRPERRGGQCTNFCQPPCTAAGPKMQCCAVGEQGGDGQQGVSCQRAGDGAGIQYFCWIQAPFPRQLVLVLGYSDLCH